MQKRRCCSGSVVSSAYNPDTSRKMEISKVKGQIRQCSEGHGAKTYMGVLSLQRGRGGKVSVLISNQSTIHTRTLNTPRSLIIMHN